METSLPLSIESFSYSWLMNLKPSLESLDSSFRTIVDTLDEVSFIEMDPRSPPSKRFFKNSHSQDPKFDFPISQSPLALVDADEIFSNGYLMPLFVQPLKMEEYEASDSDSNPNLPSSNSHALESTVREGNSRCPSLKRCRTLSSKMILKRLNFLMPLYRIFRCHKSGSKTETVVERTEPEDSETLPRDRIAYSPEDWRGSCDPRSSISEAVLHCKRSIGMHKFNMDVN